MKRRGRIWLLIACGVGVAAGALVWFGDRGPQFKGRRLDDWARIYGTYQTGNAADVREARETILQAREQAIPRALKFIGYQRPPWKQWLLERLRAHPAVRRRCPAFVDRFFLEDPIWLSRAYFRALGPAGAPAIPELERWAVDPRGGRNAGSAVEALGRIGLAALPALTRVITNTQAQIRFDAIGQLNYLGGNAGPAVPALVVCAQDTNWQIAACSVELLGRLALAPEMCVPAITNQFRRPEASCRRMAVWSLANYGQAARPAVPAVIGLLADPDMAVRDAATNALHRIAAEVLGGEEKVPWRIN